MTTCATCGILSTATFSFPAVGVMYLMTARTFYNFITLDKLFFAVIAQRANVT